MLVVISFELWWLAGFKAIRITSCMQRRGARGEAMRGEANLSRHLKGRVQLEPSKLDIATCRYVCLKSSRNTTQQTKIAYFLSLTPKLYRLFAYIAASAAGRKSWHVTICKLLLWSEMSMAARCNANYLRVCGAPNNSVRFWQSPVCYQKTISHWFV